MRIVVDTELDVVADDGLTSLREAIALAGADTLADTIVFDATVSTVTISNSFFGDSALTGFGGFTIDDERLTIDGDSDGDGLPDVVIDAAQRTAHLHVKAGAEVTITGIAFENGRNLISPGDAEEGADGEDAFGAILNEGELTLAEVTFAANVAEAQDGGDGASRGKAGGGLDGTDGRDGALFVTAKEGNPASDGKNGADGGDGGDGGDAAGAILNLGALSLTDVGFAADNRALAGDGGDGGKGGDGGDGGDGGFGGDQFTAVVFNTTAKKGGAGGDGGNGGVGGDAGDTGDAASYILNRGMLEIDGGIAAPDAANAPFKGIAGVGGDAGAGGAAGEGGRGGAKLLGGFAGTGSAGGRGLTPASGDDGEVGEGDDIVGADVANRANALVFAAGAEDVTEGEALSFTINRLGDLTETIHVFWALNLGDGLTADDFAPGTVFSGLETLDGDDPASISISFETVLDTALETTELATFVIDKNADTGVGGSALGKSEVKTRIAADDEAARALNNVFRGDSASDDVDGGGGRDKLLGFGGADSLTGGADNDTLVGGVGADTLIGGEGDDVLKGRIGRDVMEGGAGDDTLIGGAGKDVMDGGDDDDQLTAGAGRDILTGGSGEDLFIFGTLDRTDRITDFEQGLDRISLTAAGGIDDLKIAQRGDDVFIKFENTRIFVENQDVGDFSDADFIF